MEKSKRTLRSENIIKVFGKRTVVKAVSFSVSQGEIVGLLGPNGAGKTTSFYITVGFIKATEGNIYLYEADERDVIGRLIHLENDIISLNNRIRESVRSKNIISKIKKRFNKSRASADVEKILENSKSVRKTLIDSIKESKTKEDILEKIHTAKKNTEIVIQRFDALRINEDLSDIFEDMSTSISEIENIINEVSDVSSIVENVKNINRISDLPMYKRAKKGIGYLPQESSIFRKLTVEENLLAILQYLDMTPSERKAKADALLEELAITHVRDQKAFTLSGGERRRAEIARALTTDPDFLLLDEPFAGVDPIAVYDIQTIIASLKEKNLGILITDHNVRETLRITDRAYIMNQGEILVEGNSEKIISDETARKVYLGESFSM